MTWDLCSLKAMEALSPESFMNGYNNYRRDLRAIGAGDRDLERIVRDFAVVSARRLRGGSEVGNLDAYRAGYVFAHTEVST